MIPKQIIDTQIIIDRFNGVKTSQYILSMDISSVTAKEFLWAQSKLGEQPEYYILSPERYKNTFIDRWTENHFNNPRYARYANRKTDRFCLDFNNEIPSYIEYGDRAITKLINTQNIDVFTRSILHLSKKNQEALIERFFYLLQYKCFPLDNDIAEIGLNLFYQFRKGYTFKDGIKNTINDILILSTAKKYDAKLVSKDKLLNRFAAEMYRAKVTTEQNERVIDFSVSKSLNQDKKRESKGYINSGWCYAINN